MSNVFNNFLIYGQIFTKCYTILYFGEKRLWGRGQSLHDGRGVVRKFLQIHGQRWKPNMINEVSYLVHHNLCAVYSKTKQVAIICSCTGFGSRAIKRPLISHLFVPLLLDLWLSHVRGYQNQNGLHIHTLSNYANTHPIIISSVQNLNRFTTNNIKSLTGPSVGCWNLRLLDSQAVVKHDVVDDISVYPDSMINISIKMVVCNICQYTGFISFILGHCRNSNITFILTTGGIWQRRTRGGSLGRGNLFLHTDYFQFVLWLFGIRFRSRQARWKCFSFLQLSPWHSANLGRLCLALQMT